MSRIAIRARSLLTPTEEIPDAMLLVEDGRIAAAGKREAIELPAGTREYDGRPWTLAPGFIDIHIHGAGGCDVMGPGAEALAQTARTVARFGTTAMVATTVTASPDDTCWSLERIARAAERQAARPDEATPAAELLGIHFEGPFISPARGGVHPREWIARPSSALLGRMLEAAGKWGRILTLAPELDGALELVEQGRKAGLVVAIGHTDASYEEAVRAIERGACHAVHVFNAMRPFSHRGTGVLGAILTRGEVTAEVIADGVHVDGAALQILLAAKGIGQTILVSDGTAATAMPDGTYRLGTFEVRVLGGVCRDGEGRLAGSTLTLDRAVRQMVALGARPLDAVRMATLNPARRLGLETRKGILAAGADADLIFLDDRLFVAAVMTSRMPEPQRIQA
ncbi:MAG TPA: N-acetylglucosamine-6-phosphate deacetylase [Candidatus Dormibacteraeota bacterium]|nr:N-acetylglucosamine-6-phosphate deacetylase [Candidatus Dormibacteraeota bacterium]